MKILYHHRIASKDGQYVHVEELIQALRKSGHEVIVVGSTVIEQKDFGTNSGLIVGLKKYLPKAIYECLEFSYSFWAFLKLFCAMVKYKPDALYERYNLFLVAGIWLKSIFNLPMLLEVNAPLFDERELYNGIFLKRFAKWTENYIWRNADYVLPVTQVLANIVINQADIKPEKIVVIHNGIDQEKFNHFITTDEPKTKLNLGGKFVLGFTGFLREWHRLDLVVDSLADVKLADDVHFLIVGNGPARAELERRAISRGVVEKITFTGIVPRSEIAKYISCFDIALQPAVVSYASPLKLFEYLALGKVIIATPRANIKEIIQDNINGFLLDYESGQLPDKINFLRDNPSLMIEISKNAKQTIIEKRLTWMENAEKVVGLIPKNRN